MPFNERFTITPRYIPAPSRRRAGIPLTKVRFLVAHDTGNPGSSAAANVKFYIDTCQTVPPAKTASAHLFVDDKEILECVPALTANTEKAFHVMKAVKKDNELFGINANDGAIGVEYCYGGNINADKAYEKYVWVLAKLCDQFELDPAKDITGHFILDPLRKTDPVTGLSKSRRTFEQLLRDVKKEYEVCKGITLPTVPTAATEGEVTAVTGLNLRKEPTTRSAVVEVIARGTKLKYISIVQDGERVNNNPIWYKSEKGDYFWSGGVK